MTTDSSKPRGMRRQPRQARSQERVNQILDVAEQLFIMEGYNATSTNAIAANAKVPIGSLYQFFPDKAAILYGLAARYNQQLHHLLVELNTPESKSLTLSRYMEQVIDTVDQFFTDYPGYHAIFMPLQSSMPELEAIDAAADAQLIEDLVMFISEHYPDLEPIVYEAIAFVLVKTIGILLWTSLSHEKKFRQQLVTETKRLTLSYLQSYL
ncbi:TetR/AcrR family transcriptional regulator [Nostoc sp. C110]|uniref:TetR/AcrR family transcriptional regulator n=1 Tax=Nostoc sp. C110 TaxID=3349876 RepID=UPI00370DB906